MVNLIVNLHDEYGKEIGQLYVKSGYSGENGEYEATEWILRTGKEKVQVME